MTITIKAFPRVHLGLISMHADGARQNGGVGFALSDPGIIVTLSQSSELEIVDNRTMPSTPTEISMLKDHLELSVRHMRLKSSARVEIRGDMKSHYGFGSGTAIRLACIEGLGLVAEREFTRSEIISLSGRGGTSGVGINTYFDGGLVLDAGVRNRGREFIPSSKAQAPETPLSLLRLQMPDWPILVCIPDNCRPKSPYEELAFFKRTAPVSASSSYEAAYHATFGVASSILEKDYEAFCTALNRMQLVDWKRAERDEHAPELTSLDRALRAGGADCVALSSLGPLVIALAPADRMPGLVAIASEEKCWSMLTSARNSGREVDSY